MFKELSDDQILQELGRRFDGQRLVSRIADRDIFLAGGVKKDTLAHFKKGKPVTLLNFIKILRGAGCLDRLEQLFPPADTESPMAQVSRPSARSPRRIRRPKHQPPGTPFQWGEP